METLEVTAREASTNVDKLRKDGVMPAVLYGKDTESTSVSLPMADFVKLFQKVGTSTVFELKNKDGDSKPALIQEVSVHPVTDEPLHADFYVIEEGQKVSVDLPIEFVNTAPAVKNLGGFLVKVLHSVEVEADPTKLPPHIEADVSGLEDFDSQLTVADIDVPEGVEIQAEDDEVVALVNEPTEEEELEEEEEEELDFEDIEVEGERPDEEEMEEGEEVEEGQEDQGDSVGQFEE